jgi:GxxExxY protein
MEGEDRCYHQDNSNSKNDNSIERETYSGLVGNTSKQRICSRKGYDFGIVTDKILKCAVEVHRELGSYFMETTYQVALALEFQAESLDFERECWVNIYYKGKRVDRRRVDFVVEDVIVEVKAKAALEDKDYIQTLAYLKATDYATGLLINFGGKRIEVKRLKWDRQEMQNRGKRRSRSEGLEKGSWGKAE